MSTTSRVGVSLRKSWRGRYGFLFFNYTVLENLTASAKYWMWFEQISPLSTLESSFEALNVKKFDGNFIT